MGDSYDTCEEFLMKGADMDVESFLEWWKEPHTVRCQHTTKALRFIASLSVFLKWNYI